MSHSLTWARRVFTLAALATTASPLLTGCGSGAITGDAGASGDGGASADGTTMMADAALDDAAASDGLADAGNPESGDEAAVDVSDAGNGCMPPLFVKVSVATNEANLVVPNASECTVTAQSTPDAVLTYEDIGTGAGDYPFGEVWVPSGSSWHISTPDGGLVGQGMTSALKFQCFDPPAPIKTSLLLTNGAGAMLSLSVGCQSDGLVFVVYGVSFTSGGTSGDASPE
jgi:hypothetical protein